MRTSFEEPTLNKSGITNKGRRLASKLKITGQESSGPVSQDPEAELRKK